MNQLRNLIVWEKSIKLTSKVYRLTERLPMKERFGLIQQMNRSVVSIPSNIAEGAGRNSDKEFNYFLGIANGSAYELETQIMLCTELNYFKNEDVGEVTGLLTEIQKMIYSLQLKIKKDNTEQNNIDSPPDSQDSRLESQD